MNLAHFSVGSIGFVSHRSLARKSRLGLGFLALVFATSVLRAPPTGGTVVAGSATIATNQNTTTVTAGNNSVLSWGSFNVGSTEVVQFVQPGATARVLNWIGGSTPSQIDGSLLANGQVYLVNPAGVYFGQTAVVDVGQLYAIGGSLSKEDFLAGLNRFSGLTGDVRNDGSLQGSAVALVGRTVLNTGSIVAPDGFVALVAGEQVVLGRNGSSIFVDAGSTVSGGAPPATTTPGVANSGTIDAGSGSIVLAAGDLYAVAITQDGSLTAHNVALQGQGGGDVLISGTINASATGAGETGGNIEITGNRVGLLASAQIDASGPAGGGTILVGGDLHGANPDVRDATATTVMPGATLNADATQAGNGGKIVVWSNDTTLYFGNLSARGGPLGGNGGFAEVSGKNLGFDGNANLASGPGGTAGTLLLDPDIVNIGTDTTDDGQLNGIPPGVITFGQDPGATYNISATAVESSLNKQTTVIDANSAINVNAAIDASGNPNTFDLVLGVGALGTITLSADVTTKGAQVYNGAVTLGANTTLTGTTLSLGSTLAGAGNDLGLVFSGGNLVNGAVITGVKNLSTSAGPTTLTGPITTSGTQTYNTAVTLSGDTTLTGTALTLGSTLAGAGNDLGLAFSGGNLVNGAVITGVKNLSTSAGPTTLTGLITTSGTQTYNTAATLGADTTLASTGNGNIALDSTVDGAFALTVDTTGTTTLGGAVGNSTALVSVTTEAGGTTVISGGAVTTTGAQTYNGTVTQGADTTITGNALTIGGASWDAGNHNLTLTLGTNVTVPGAFINLNNFTSNGAGGTTVGASMTTGGSQTYGNAVTLAGPTTLASTGNGNIALNNTVDGAFALTVDTTGTTTLGGAVGNSIPLVSVTTEAGGTTAISGGAVTTTGAQAYNGAVTLGANTTLTGSALTLGSTLAGAGNDLGLVFSGGNLVNGAVITGVKNLSTSAGPTTLTGPITTSGTQTYNTAVTLSGDTTLTGTALTLGSTLAGAGNDLGLVFSGGNLVNGAVITGVKNLSTSAGPTTLTGLITTSGTQTYNTAATLGADTTLASTGNGNIALDSTVDGAFALTVDTTGTTTLGGAVGNSTALVSVTTEAGGTTAIDGGAVTTTGPQAYNGAVTLGANTTLTGTTLSLGSTLAGAGNNLGLVFSGGDLVNGAVITGVKNLSTSAGPTTLTGPITTSGTQTYNTAATLAGDTTLTGTALTLGSTLAGAGNDLGLAFSGGNLVNGAVITGVKNLSTSAGPTTLTGLITTSGTQTYNTAATLGADTTLASTGNGNIALDSTVDGAFALTVNTTGTTTLGGAVGNSTALVSVTTEAGGTTVISGGAVTTTGAQTYNGTVTQGADTTITGNALTIGGASWDAGNHNLTLTLGTNVTVPGAFINLNNFTSNGAGGTTVGASMTTGGSQTYGNAVTLAGPTTLASTGNGNIALNNTVDGAFALTVDTTGTTTLGGAVGNSIPLVSVTTEAGGTTAISGGAVTTTGAQVYNGAVTLGANTTLTGTTLSLGSTLAGAGNDLGLVFSGGNLVNGAVITGVKNLSTSAGPTTLTGPITTSGTQTYNTAVTLSGDTTLTGTALTLGSTLAGAGNDLGLAFSGGNLVNGAVITGVKNLSTSAGPTTLTGLITTSGTQTYNTAATLGADTTLASTGNGNIALDSTVDGAFALTVDTTGTTTLGGAVGNSTALVSVTTEAGGTTVISGGAVTTTGAQTYNGTVTQGADTTITGNALTIGGASWDAGNHNLTLTLGTNVTVPGAFINLNNFTSNGAGGTTVGASMTTGGSQTYGNAVTLAGPTTLASTGNGNIALNNTVDGAFALTVDTTGTTTLGGAVGNSIPLVSVTTEAGGTTAISGGAVTTTGAQAYNGAVTLGANTTLTGSALTLGSTLAGAGNDLGLVFSGGNLVNGAVITGVKNLSTSAGPTTLTGPITTSGTQTYNTAVTLSGDTTLTGTALTLGSTLAGAGNDLGLVFSGGNLVNGAVITGVKNLSTSAGPTTLTGLITTSGTQTYNTAATLGADTTLASTGNGNIALDSTVDGAFALTVDTTGTTTLGGAVGNSTALVSVTTEAGGTTAIDGGAVTTTGPQAYNGAVTLGANTTLTGTTLSLGSTLAGAGNNLGLVFSGGDLVNGAVITGVKNLSTSAGPTTLTGPITTSGTQTYNTAATLAGPTTLASTGNGNIALNNTVDGAFALTVDTTGTTTLGGAVGNSTALVSVTTEAGGTTAIDGGAVTTTGAQAYNGAVTLGANTTLTGTALTLGSTLAGAGNDLGLVFSGGDLVNGAVITGVKNLSTSAGPTTLTGPITTSGTQTYNTAATLVGPTTLASTGNGNIALNSTVDGAFALTVDTTGTTTLGGAVGNSTALVSVTTEAGGTTAIDGGAVTTTGAQAYNGAVTLGANTTLTGSALTLGSTLAGAGDDLGLVFSGGDLVNGAVITGVKNLSTSAGPTTLTGLITTSGTQTYNTAATLAGDTTLTGTALTLGSTLAGAGNNLGLVFSGGDLVNGAVITGVKNLSTSAGPTTLTGPITTSGTQTYNTAATLVGDTTLTGTALTLGSTLAGAGNDLGLVFSGGDLVNGAVITGVKNLSTSAGPTTLTGPITTSGTQTYNTAATLAGPTTLASTGNGNIALNSTVDGAFALTVDTTGTTTLGGAVGNSTALVSVTTEAGGTTAIDGGAVTTTGPQAYNGAVTLGADTTLTGSALTLGSTLAGAGDDLGLVFSGGDLVNGAVITGVKNLSTSAGPTTLTGLITTSGTQTYNTAVTLSGDTTLTGTALTLGSTLAGAGDDLGLVFSGGDLVNGAVITGVKNLSTSAGPTTLTGPITTSGTQTYNTAATLVGDTTLTGTALTLGSTLAGAGNDLGLVFSGGDLVNGAVITGVKNLSTSAGPTTLTGPITTSGTQTYNTAATLAGPTTLASTGNGNIALNSTVDGAFALTVDTTGTTTLGGAVGNSTALVSVTTEAGGTTAIDGGAVTTAGAQAYNGAVTLGRNTTLTGTTLSLGSTLAGAGDDLGLVFSGGDLVNGAVITGVKNLSTSAGPTTLTGLITTSGTQTYNTAATLAGPTTLAAGGSLVWFKNTVDDGQTLAITGAGGARFDGAVGGGNGTELTSLSVTGATALNAASVTTSGAQTYTGPVTLGAAGNATTLTGTDIGFAGTVRSAIDGQQALTVSGSGTVTFSDAVGDNSQRLASLTTNAGGATALNGGAVTTTGAQTYNGPVTLGAAGNATTLTGTDITFAGAVSNAIGGQQALTVSGSGTVTAEGDLGSESARLQSVSASGQNMTIAGNVWTEGDISLAIGSNTGTPGANGASNVNFLAFNNKGDTSNRDTRIDSATGNIILGTGAVSGPNKTGAPLLSSIFKSNPGDLYLFGSNVKVEPFERLSVSNGSLVIIADGTGNNEGVITLSSTAVSNYLVLVSSAPLSVPGIILNSRQPADIDLGVRNPPGQDFAVDLGTDLVAGAVLMFNTNIPDSKFPTRTDFTPSPTPGPTTDPTLFDYATDTGNLLTIDAQNAIKVSGPYEVFIADLLISNPFRPAVPNLVYLDLSTASGFGSYVDKFINFSSPTFDIDLQDSPIQTLDSAGAQVRNTVEQAFAPAVPRQDIEVAISEADLTTAVREQLQALGIYARPLNRAERLSRERRAGMFVTVPPREHPREADYEVADARVGDRPVREVIRLATETGLIGEGQGRLDEVARALAASFEAFSAAVPSGDGGEFRTWLETRSDSNAKKVLDFAKSLQATLKKIELLGLTRQELEGSKAQIYGSVLRSRLNAEPEFIRAFVEGLPRSANTATLWSPSAAAPMLAGISVAPSDSYLP